MTVTQLIRQLEKLKAEHGNVRVAVDLPTFDDGNGTFHICDVTGAKEVTVQLLDGDGFQERTKAGVARERSTIVLHGSWK